MSLRTHRHKGLATVAALGASLVVTPALAQRAPQDATAASRSEPLAPPWASTSVTSVVGAQMAAPAPPPQPGSDPATAQRLRALETEVAALKRRDASPSEWEKWAQRLRITGFVQPQFVAQAFNDAASPNADAATGELPRGISANQTIARTDGTTTNRNAFRLRRGRIKFEYMPTDYARFVVELEPFVAGDGVIGRQVEAQGIARWNRFVETEFAAGIFKVPFSFALLQSDADRPFVERSLGERNMFPGEFDTGARAYTRAFQQRLVAQLAVLNGSTLGEKNFGLVPDLNRGKDIVARVSYDFGPVDVGASGYVGRGQRIDGVALRVKQFMRWAGHLEGAVHHAFVRTLGETRLWGEVNLAENMDRGVIYDFAVPAIPDDIHADVKNTNQFGAFVAATQDLTQWVTLGVRYDRYTPDRNIARNTVESISGVGVLHFTKGLQLMLEFDHTVDNAHAPMAVARSKKIETVSSVLQARF